MDEIDSHTSVDQFSKGGGPTWAEYAAALQFLDRHWRRQQAFGVLGEKPSWEDTILRGQALFYLDSWEELSSDQLSLIAPAHSFAAGDALLGSVGRRSTAVRDFLLTDKAIGDRERVLVLLKKARDLKLSTIPIIGGDILAEMMSIRGLGRSFATRLLALARPDGFIVLNNKSTEWLRQATGLELGSGQRAYNDLLRWVARQRWHGSPEPVDALEKRLWQLRAALVDAFAYRPWS